MGHSPESEIGTTVSHHTDIIIFNFRLIILKGAIMRMMRLLKLALGSTRLMAASAAMPTNGGYSNGVGFRTMSQQNFVHKSSNVSNNSSP